MVPFYRRPNPHPSSVDLECAEGNITTHHFIFSICNLDQKRKGENIRHITLIFNAIIELVYKVFIKFILLYTGNSRSFVKTLCITIRLFSYHVQMCCVVNSYFLCSPKNFGGTYGRRLVRPSFRPSVRFKCPGHNFETTRGINMKRCSIE